MDITKGEIEKFQKDCKARGLRLPVPCTDEWCIKQIEDLENDLENDTVQYEDMERE